MEENFVILQEKAKDLHDDDFIENVDIPKLKDSNILVRKEDELKLTMFNEPETIRLDDVKIQKLALAARISIDRQ